MERENPDILASAYTDRGTIPNLKFSCSGARNRVARWGQTFTA
jgi:oxalate decarboxylase